METRVVRYPTRHLTAAALGIGLGLALGLGAGCKREPAGQGSAGSGAAKPAAPITINVIDVAGTLQLVQDALEAYHTKHPDKVEKFTLNKAPAPELPAKLLAMQNAGRMDIDLVFSGLALLMILLAVRTAYSRHETFCIGGECYSLP